MAKTLEEWLDSEVRPLRNKPVRWLSEFYFLRDPARPRHVDPEIFFAPADGVLLYQRTVNPDEPLVELKGRRYTLQDALRDPDYDRQSLVVGIFMTFYDVHVNRVPYSGRLSYRVPEPVETHNHPMLDMEHGLLAELRPDLGTAEYLFRNQRVVNRFVSPALDGPYHVLQIADRDVRCVIPFDLRQNRPCRQGERFSQIRYGSQVDLVVPLSARYGLEFLQAEHSHVEAGVDPLVRIVRPGAGSRP
ncbi:phosphatidylserine decarboxylase [Streptoalloteichus hindustanus]|uniref:Phosphatidylserine decarboxylase n=1 Tax=Streptoalloteichus hindustanus TaxID=2017 RepID=A0A1M5I6T5_STRHI|nr:phosphatidylserine decarboxylase [Streptoalloteichus hindustanus]SHG24068.1 phosphatidylserine decarboxylase [Streptoalloteichus hindustanus]